ncbi:ABC transporter ATP-binding protein [Tabrizicola sp.]|uniref:ABC transporter ATP-binding protein n=1 Tax=Tabrizicola sp. TaxID=2005166 RepID=UPI0027335BBD|nr:ABC transporter ATP-binding protein [Tabrizicola sp.]MDP3197257.1 ABC transporter ATP-binding protein [Tabrizicola sp.]MDP3320519.1 ABC transporter ATP-binding protein [Bosea sp. (in: a-proteobacteria)]
MSLTASDLVYGYRERVIGRDIVVSLARGEVLALLGPNGSGKTTLLKTLLGLLPARSGTLLLDDRPLAALSPPERARSLGYVPQAHAGTFAFTVETVVLMGRSAHAGLFTAPSARDHTVAFAMLERLGIARLAQRPYTEISGGERQLVLIARALAQEPAYVVLDEPTASLDFGNQGRVMQEIRRLAAEGLGVLFTTHDPNQALRHADRVMMIRDGQAIASGGAMDLLTPERLQRLYGVGIETVRDGDGRIAFLPG